MNISIQGVEFSTARRWRARLDGSFALFDETDRDVSPRGRKARAIIVYLITHQGLRVPRERLMALLWGDRGEQQARDSLRQALAEIRRACGNLINAERDQVWIDGASLTRDTLAIADAGEFAEDLNHITPEFDDWLASARQHEASEAWKELRDEVEALLAQGRGPEAMALIERMQLIDPYNEDWLRLAMQAEAQAGHPAAIQQAYRQLAARLQRELGVAPTAATRALHDQLISELTGRAPHELKSDAVLDPVRQGVPPSEAHPPAIGQVGRSGVSRRLVVGGTLAGVAAAVAGTPFWLQSGETVRSPTALEYYRRGIELRGQASLSQAEQSVAYLREATRVDPDFGEAWGALAWGYRGLLEYGPRPDQERTAMLSRTAAARALEIDPGNSQARAALLLLKPIYGNWQEIESGCRRLLKDDAARSLIQFNLALTLCEVGRWRDALPILTDLARREPFWPLVQMRIFCALVSVGRLEEAEDSLEATIKKWPRRADFWSMKIHHLLEAGRFPEAVTFANDPAKRPANADRLIQIQLNILEAFAKGSVAARRDAAARLADHARSDPRYVPVVLGGLSLVGDVATGLDMLEGYYLARGPWRAAHQDRPMTSVLFLASTAPIREDRRFDALLRDTGLERYWAETKTVPDYRRFA